MTNKDEVSKYLLKEWKKIENLHSHKALTTSVRSRLKKIKNELEKRIILVDTLLEKPLKKEDEHGTGRKGKDRKIARSNT